MSSTLDARGGGAGGLSRQQRALLDADGPLDSRLDSSSSRSVSRRVRSSDLRRSFDRDRLNESGSSLSDQLQSDQDSGDLRGGETAGTGPGQRTGSSGGLSNRLSGVETLRSVASGETQSPGENTAQTEAGSRPAEMSDEVATQQTDEPSLDDIAVTESGELVSQNQPQPGRVSLALRKEIGTVDGPIDAAKLFSAQLGTNISAGEVVERDGTYQIREGVSDQIRRRQAAEQFSDQLGTEVSPWDVIEQGGEYRLDDDRLREINRQRAAETLDERIEGVDIGTGDVVEQDGRFVASEGVLVEQVDASVPEIDLGREDLYIERADGDVQTRLRPSAQVEYAEQQTAQETGLEPGEDFTLEPDLVPDGLQRANPDASTRRVDLTAAGRSELIVDRVREQGGIETDDGEFIEVEPDELTLNKQGELVGIQRGPTTTDRLASALVEGAALTLGSGTVVDVAEGIASAEDDLTDPLISAGGDAIEGLIGAPGVGGTAGAIEDGASFVESKSEEAAKELKEEIDETGGVTVPTVVGSTVQERRIGTGVGAGGAKALVDFTAGGPAALVGAGRGIVGGTETLAEEIGDKGLLGGSATAAGAGVATGVDTIADLEGAFRRNPAETTGQVAGGFLASGLAAPRAISAARSGARAAPGPTPTAGRFLLGESRGVTVGLSRTEGKVEDVQPLLTAASNLRGRTPFEVGTPRVDLDRATSNTDSDVIEPQLGGAEITALTAALRREGFETDADRIERARNVQRETQQADLAPDEAEPVIRDVLDRQEVDPDVADDIIRVMAERDAELKGSIVQDAAGSQVGEPGVGRVPRDIDTVVGDPEGFAASIGDALGDAVKVSGSEIRSAATGEKLFDVLGEDDFAPQSTGEALGGSQRGNITALGLRREDTVETDEGVTTTTLSEQTARKLQGAFKEIGSERRDIGRISGAVTPRQEGRVKDIPDFYAGERANIAALRQQGDRRRADRAEQELDEFLRLFDDSLEQRARREAGLDDAEVEFTLRPGESGDAQLGGLTPDAGSGGAGGILAVDDGSPTRPSRADSPSPRRTEADSDGSPRSPGDGRSGEPRSGGPSVVSSRGGQSGGSSAPAVSGSPPQSSAGSPGDTRSPSSLASSAGQPSSGGPSSASSSPGGGASPPSAYTSTTDRSVSTTGMDSDTSFLSSSSDYSYYANWTSSPSISSLPGANSDGGRSVPRPLRDDDEQFEEEFVGVATDEYDRDWDNPIERLGDPGSGPDTASPADVDMEGPEWL